jgi:hypothetical protein
MAQLVKNDAGVSFVPLRFWQRAVADKAGVSEVTKASVQCVDDD